MKRYRLEILAALLLVAWCGLFIHRSRVWTWPGETTRTACLFDDAMIGMRYAENLARGHGLVWNPGERVEGYTNFLWILAMTGVHALTGDRGLACLAVQLLGVVVMLAIGWGTRSLALRLTGNLAVARLSALLSVSYYPLVYWSLMGMETGLATLCVLLAARDLLHRTAHPRFLWGYPLACAAAVLARPDLLLVAILFLAARYPDARRAKTTWNVFLEGALFALPVGLHLLWRHATYGEWLPNTYTLKVEGLPLSLRLENGLGYSFLHWETLAMPALALAAGLAAGLSTGVQKLIAPILAMHLYQIWVGGDPWPLWRFTCPVLPLLAVLLAVSLDTVVRRFIPTSDLGKRPPRSRAVLTVGTLLLLAGLNIRNLDGLLLRRIYQKWNNQDNVWLAHAVQDATAPDAVVACFWGGTVPYFTGRPAVDFLGKMDPHIARLPPDATGAVSWDGMRSVPGHNKYDLDWTIATYRPDVIAEAQVRWGRQRIDEDPTFLARYMRVRHVRIPEDAASPVLFWVLRDSPRVRYDRLVPAR